VKIICFSPGRELRPVHFIVGVTESYQILLIIHGYRKLPRVVGHILRVCPEKSSLCVPANKFKILDEDLLQINLQFYFRYASVINSRSRAKT